MLTRDENHFQWRILDFPAVEAPTVQGEGEHTISPNFPKNCMKLKEFGRGGDAPLMTSLDPPLILSYQ